MPASKGGSCAGETSFMASGGSNGSGVGVK